MTRSPIQQQRRWLHVGVVLRELASSLQLLPLPASLCMRLRQWHTARRRAQPRLGQQMVSCITIAKIQGFYKRFSLTWFSVIVEYHFLAEIYFSFTTVYSHYSV